MTPLVVLVALASGVPTFDIESVCRSARNAALPEDQPAAYDSCLRDERDSRDKLNQAWPKYSAAARSACSEEGGFSLSYVELWTCLEMQPGGSLSVEPAKPAGKPAKP
jgi:hypothetical protein